MMTNLFSMFDPSNFYLILAWLTPFIILLSPVLKTYTKYQTLTKKMILYLKSEFFSMTSSNMSNILLIPLFLLILLSNLISLIPSSFATTSQLSIVFPLALSLWLSTILFFLMTKTNKFLSHLVPSGSPNLLMPILVMIELVSNLIRPITLSVRLIANITAGHLLMHLLSGFSCSIFNSPAFFLTIPISMILSMLELGVAFIQSYILCTLIGLYSSEIK